MAAEGTEAPFWHIEKPTEGSDSAKDWEDYDKILEGLALDAERSERFEDMCGFLTELVESRFDRSETLNERERGLLSVSFKNVVGNLRNSVRNLSEFTDDPEAESTIIQKYQTLIKMKLEGRCLEVLGLLETKLIPNCPKDTDSEVFYLKMCGDYYRYLAEFSDKELYKTNTEEKYKRAYAVATKILGETHPTRLGLALNFSVCYFEILKNPKEATRLAKAAFDEAIAKLDSLDDSTYRDSTLIMQLLRDNLTLWTQRQDNEDEED